MGESVSEFGHATPTTSAAFNALLATLDDLLRRAKQAAARQLEGITQSRGATALRTSLEGVMRGTHLGHLAQVATSASQEEPNIRPAFRLAKDARTIRGFRNGASRIAEAAQEHRELLSKYGLAETMIEDLVATLDKYDGAVLQGVEGRRSHVEASAELTRIAGEISRVVQVMDGFQQLRFARDPEKLAAWESARKVLAERRSPAETEESNSGTPASDVRPAA
jgi:hypothetical protein